MTHNHDHTLYEALKTKDLRLTEARISLYGCLKDSTKALTPKELYKKLKDKTDMASIYRNLALFEDLGLVHSLSNGHYSLCEHNHSHSDQHDHIHVIMSCKVCEKTEEIKNHSSKVCSAAKELASIATPLQQTSSILLKGVCKACNKK